MKGNNSLTCAKTVQKQPFLMSDTSCPRDAFYVSNSLIKQHPRRARPGTQEAQACASVRACVRNFFAVWIVRCDLGALIFTQQGSITPIVVLFIVFFFFFFSDNPLVFSLSKEVGSFFFLFFLSGCLSFCQTLNIKRVKSKKWNSLQWGVLPAKEWGGVRFQNDSRCVLLNRILLYIFFLRLPWNVIGGSLYPFRIFCSVFFCQTVKPGACTVARSIANTKEHHCKFAYQCVLSTSVASPFWYRFFWANQTRAGYIKAFKW